MNDPHVTAVYYELQIPDSATYVNPPPIERDTNDFLMHLENGVAKFEIKDHYATPEAARAITDSYMKAWEIVAGLEFGPGDVIFTYVTSDILDRNPLPNTVVAHIGTQKLKVSLYPVTAHGNRARYPEPPEQFAVSPDVETMWHRFEGYRQGRELLSSMAYFCVTCFEHSAHPDTAPARYRVSAKILSTLRRLSSDIGDSGSARKVTGHAPRPHTAEEVRWIEAAIKLLIRRLGEWAFEPTATLPQLTMANLPPL